MLIEEFDGAVPRTLEELVRLPGVARKTANVVAAELGEPQGIVVDTHVRRLSQRLGLTRQDDPVKIERDLMRLVPREDWGVFPHLLIWHGRRVCIARTPALRGVRADDLCPSSRVERARATQQPAVLVVGREEVGGHRLRRARAECAARAARRAGARPTRARARPGSRRPRRRPARTPPRRPARCSVAAPGSRSARRRRGRRRGSRPSRSQTTKPALGAG